jgi:AraC-like DNA-binding protein
MKSQVHIFRPDLPGLEILHVRDASGRIPAHMHLSWCLIAIERGERIITSAGRALHLKTGDAILIPQGVAHDCASLADGCDFWAMSICQDLLLLRESRAAQSASRPAEGHSPEAMSSGQVGLASDTTGQGGAPNAWRLSGAGLADRLVRIAYGKEPSGVESLLDDVAAAARQIERDYPAAASRPKQPSQAVLKARELLDGPEGTGLSLAELASRARMSPYHLARLFTRETGIAPHEYRTLSQLRRARALLGQGRSLAGAAATCGFYDQSHLTLRFKKYMGMTPGQFARSIA